MSQLQDQEVSDDSSSDSSDSETIWAHHTIRLPPQAQLVLSFRKALGQSRLRLDKANERIQTQNTQIKDLKQKVTHLMNIIENMGNVARDLSRQLSARQAELMQCKSKNEYFEAQNKMKNKQQIKVTGSIKLLQMVIQAQVREIQELKNSNSRT